MLFDFKNLYKTYPEANLLISGHSSGAALATFAALDIKEIFKNKIELTTFGMPRIGN